LTGAIGTRESCHQLDAQGRQVILRSPSNVSTATKQAARAGGCVEQRLPQAFLNQEKKDHQLRSREQSDTYFSLDRSFSDSPEKKATPIPGKRSDTNVAPHSA
jgi:hypothetical protein